MGRMFPHTDNTSDSADIVRVIAQRQCVGCGACEVASHGRIPVTIGRSGNPSANLAEAGGEDLRRASQVCPFSDDALTEDDLSKSLFEEAHGSHAVLGKYLSLAVGHVADHDQLLRSSSGGLTSWFLRALFEARLVDAVVHVGAATAPGPLYQYDISTSATAADTRRKSAYYATSFADAMEEVRRRPGRYAFVGVPCNIKAARLLARQDPTLGSRLTYFVGLVCGHLKTPAFAYSLAWQMGIHPDELYSADFRVKNPNRPVSDYDFGATRASDPATVRTHRTLDLVGGNWGHGMFQLNACNYCDDIFAETADITFGDAWLKEYSDDWRGNNVVVIRDRTLKTLFDGARDAGTIQVSQLTAERTAESQAGNIRHRRVGLAVRLADDVAAGVATPRKRVSAGSEGVSRRRVALIRQRRRISEASHAAFADALETGDLASFLERMAPLVREYKAIESRPPWKTALVKARARLVRATPPSLAKYVLRPRRLWFARTP